jgi:hypothetical protein
MNEFKWYMIMVTVFMTIMMSGTAVSDWRAMDCRLTLAQAGRTPADIKEICK